MSEILYSPGAWRAVVASGGVVVLPPTVDGALLGRIRAALDSGEGLGAVLSSLAEAFGGGFSALPPFAVVTFDADGGLRLAVRGEASVSISEDSGPVVVSGAGVSTWSERAVPAATGFVVSTPEASAGGERFAIVSGVVLVSEVAVVSGAAIESPPAAAPIAVAAPAPAPETAPAPSAAPAPEVTPEPAAALKAVSEPEPEPVPEPEPEPVPEVELTQDVASELESTQAEELESTQAELPDDAYDHLWGATVVKSVEDAAVRELDDEEAEAESAAAAVPVAPPTPPTPAPEPAPQTPSAPTPAPAVQGTGLIDSVPGFGSVGAASGSPALLGTTVPPAAPKPPQSTVAPAAPAAGPAGDDHDGLTVTVSELEAMRRLADADAAPAAAGLPADALGRIVLSTGESYDLDRPVIIGRRPRANRVQADAVPVLVTVASPEQDISRNHLEIRLEGRHVLAVDLATTNGSVLHREGTPPKRLGPNEPELVLSGDVIDLGDGVTVAFEEIP
ncbi:FHA domain-containing protein [Herbiconiux sp. VKM Ac-2851]|uniref:FHA domain-containing protein n=1 Tax=Herbiconiux sp. VKM Ac-2851 TaxID=2739025 RepID=UPI0015648908|nr:FHA domain-containing protein [Herbiconiux sp. VKM Ac-2851]NQX34621.1 FHA domain-containing protein [Herbiconiux sp. VKM Ac-2851]